MQVARGEHAHKIKFYPCELGKFRVPLVFSASFSGTACGLYKRATLPNRIVTDGRAKAIAGLSHLAFVRGYRKKCPKSAAPIVFPCEPR